MNIFHGMGRLARDPEIRYSQQGGAIADFTIAIDRRYKREGQPDADFFQVTAFGKLAEFVEKYLVKGTKIVFSAEVQNNNYEDKNGVKHYGTKMIANSIEFAESKKAASDNAPTDEPKSGTNNTTPAVDDGFMNVADSVDDESLPFN